MLVSSASFLTLLEGLLVTNLRFWVPGVVIWEDTLGPGLSETVLTWSVMWGDRLRGCQAAHTLLEL